MDNFLSASPLLISHIQSELKPIPEKNVREAVSLDWVVKNPLTPAVNVIFFDDVPDVDGGTTMQGKVQTSSQYWLIMLTLRNVADAGPAAEASAGVVIVQLLQSLQGCRLSRDHQPLHRKKCPYRKTVKDGVVHFPFLFASNVIVTGTAEPY